MTDKDKRIAELEDGLNELRISCGTLLYEYDAGAVDDQTLQDCDDKCARAASLLEQKETGERVRRTSEDAFIVIHEGDGRHAVICHSHKEAAEAIIKGMWSGTVQEALEQDDFLRGMYEETIDPQSDSWADFDGQRVGWAFEDGRVDVIRIPVEFPHTASDTPPHTHGDVERELEFAWTREGEILVGYNPRSEEGGWVRVGVVTKAVSKIEAERDEALESLAGARQMICAVRYATGDLDEAPAALSAMRPSVDEREKIAEIRARHDSVADMADDEWDNRIYTIADDAFSDRAFLLSAIEGGKDD